MEGKKLGRFRIEGRVGAGGMGEVYKARDSELGRTVAIKILPEQLTQSQEMRARLRREAQSASALSHPHICALYDIGSEDGRDFLVMEYLQGETLAERLKRGSLDLAEILRLGAQIADALAAAHNAGLVHRDLKPGNIMLTSNGAKLLDFGLARPAAMVSSSAETVIASAEGPLTAQGQIMGTPQYMSPEQIAGKEADSRSDVFALGAVLYEMAGGKPAFSGDSSAHVLAAVLERQPATLSDVRQGLPSALVRMVGRCLEKDPVKRWQSAADARWELEWMADPQAAQPGQESPMGDGPRRRPWSWIGLTAALGVLLAVSAVLLVVMNLNPHGILHPMRMDLSLPAGLQVQYPLSNQTLSLSPDGRRLVVVGRREGEPWRLWLRELDGTDMRPLGGTEGGDLPAFSPDSARLAFRSDGKLRVIALEGESAPTTLGTAWDFGISWKRGGILVNRPLDGAKPAGWARYEPREGISETRFMPEPANALWPHLLGSNQVVARAGHELVAGPLDSTKLTSIGESESRAVYANGHLLYIHEDALVARAFDPGNLQFSGLTISLATDVHHYGIGAAAFSVSENGVLAYLPTIPPVQLAWFDRTGKPLGDLGEPLSLGNSFRLGPGGKLAVAELVESRASSSNVWLIDLDRGTRTGTTSAATSYSSPLLHVSGEEVLVARPTDGGVSELARFRLSNPGTVEPLLDEPLPMSVFPEDIGGDGSVLAFEDKHGGDIYLMSLKNQGKPIPWQITAADEEHPRFDPAGYWIAFSSNETGRREVFAAPVTKPAQKVRVSLNGGAYPEWSADGKELYFVAPDFTLMAVSVRGQGSETFGDPTSLFRLSNRAMDLWTPYQVHPDGRFLSVASMEVHNQIRLILNWPGLLRRDRRE